MPLRDATLVLSGKRPPRENMAADEALLLSSPDAPVLRLYGWSPPGLSLGRFQLESDAAAALRHFPRATVVLRPTGGGAIYHDDELTYAIVLRLEDPILRGESLAESYRRLDAPIVAALAELGIAARHRGEAANGSRRDEPFFCFDRRSPLDVVVLRDGRARKIAGSAQRRTATHVLQHGSLLLRAPKAIAGAVGANDARPPGAPLVTFESMAERLARAFAATLDLRFETAADQPFL